MALLICGLSSCGFEHLKLPSSHLRGPPGHIQKALLVGISNFWSHPGVLRWGKVAHGLPAHPVGLLRKLMQLPEGLEQPPDKLLLHCSPALCGFQHPGRVLEPNLSRFWGLTILGGNLCTLVWISPTEHFGNSELTCLGLCMSFKWLKFYSIECRDGFNV